MTHYKHAALILITCALLSACADKPAHIKTIASQNDWTAFKLKGKVHTRTDTTYKRNEVNGQMQRTGDLDNEGAVFDTNGFTTSQYFLPPDKKMPGGWDAQFSYKFDSAGNKIERDAKDKLLILNDYRYTYNAHGDVIEIRSYLTGEHKIVNDAGFEEKEIYNYDTSGHVTEWAFYKKDGTRGYAETYEYDTAGRQAVVHKSLYGSPFSTEQYKYDDKGNMLEKTEIDTKTNYAIITAYTYEFDAAGNCTKKIAAEVHNNMPGFDFITVTHYTYY